MRFIAIHFQTGVFSLNCMAMSSVKGHLCLLTVFLALLTCSDAQQDFSAAPIPNPFRRGDMYPPRTEIQVCRPIQDYIDRGSQRFDTQLVTNNNPDIIFATADSRIMSSRLQSRLNRLASAFYSGGNLYPPMRVLKVWTPFPDSDLTGDTGSLHYEGNWSPVVLCHITYFYMHVCMP